MPDAAGQAETALTYLRQLSERLLRQAGRSGRSEEAGRRLLVRLRQATDVLEAAGAIDLAQADQVVAGLTAALVARAMQDTSGLEGPSGYTRWYPGRPPVAPPGVVRATGIGGSLGLEDDGEVADLILLSLLLTDEQALLAAALVGAGWDRDLPGSLFAISGTAADDQGRRYEIGMHRHWGVVDPLTHIGELKVDPVPPPDIAWLKLTLPGHPPLRVSLSEPDPAPPGAAPARLSPELRAERLVDGAAQVLLGGPEDDAGHDTPASVVVLGMVEDLRAVGLLQRDSPAAGRLAALARRLGLAVPDDLAPAGPAELPPSWRAALDGPDQARTLTRTTVTATAVVLPPLAGTRFAIRGIWPEDGGSCLWVSAWGPRIVLEEGWRDFPVYRWQARDDRGQWYAGRCGDRALIPDASRAELPVLLRPALDPRATSVQIIVDGPDGQVSAVLPLRRSAAA